MDDKKPTILYCITGLGTGGAEMMLLKIVPLLQNNFDNHILCFTRKTTIGKELEKRGAKVHYANAKKASDVFRAISFTFKIIKEIKPDIQTNYLIHADLLGRIIGRLAGVKVIISNQRQTLKGLEKWQFLLFFDRLSKYLISRYTVQTITAKKELMQYLKLKNNQITIIPNAIETDKFFPINQENKINIREELSYPKDKLIITCVANFKKIKGHKYLVEAISLLDQELQNKIQVNFIGEGVEKNNTIELIEEFNLTQTIKVLGYQEDTVSALQASDIFAFPSESEGMSNAILEAMACGLPCIVSDIDVNKDIIENNKTGLLFENTRAKDLSNKIKKLLTSKELRGKFGKSARQEIVANYQTDKIAKGYADLFNSFLRD